MELSWEVFAVPTSVNNVLGRGCHQLIRDGDILVDQPQQVLAELAPQLRPLIAHYQAQDPKTHEDPAYIAQELQILLRVFGYDPVPVDILCSQLALPYSLVAAQLV